MRLGAAVPGAGRRRTVCFSTRRSKRAVCPGFTGAHAQHTPLPPLTHSQRDCLHHRHESGHRGVRGQRVHGEAGPPANVAAGPEGGPGRWAGDKEASVGIVLVILSNRTRAWHIQCTDEPARSSTSDSSVHTPVAPRSSWHELELRCCCGPWAAGCCRSEPQAVPQCWVLLAHHRPAAICGRGCPPRARRRRTRRTAPW